jgi:hypothetical protein
MVKLIWRFLMASLFMASTAAAADLKVQWQQNAAAEGVTNYNVTIDALAPVVVPNIVNTTCNCVQLIATFATGPHVVRISAVAPLITGIAVDGVTQADEVAESAPATLTFTLNPGGQIKNVTVKK